MINVADFANTSPLISPEIEGQLMQVFENLKDDITFVSIIDTNNEKCVELAIFLNHFAKFSIHIKCNFYTLDEYNKDENLQKNVPLSPEMLPVVGILKDNAFCRVAFYGIPGGKEINSFVLAILNATNGAKAPSQELIDNLQKYTKKTEILICVSLNCHHCANVVMECQRLAILNENIFASMVDANLYPNLVSEYKIERVPMTIINKTHILKGDKTAEQVLDYLNSIL